MVLQYSNQETSVTIGESVRDEDGTAYFLIPVFPSETCICHRITANLWCGYSVHSSVDETERYQ